VRGVRREGTTGLYFDKVGTNILDRLDSVLSGMMV
jgi:hypothetical protein